MDKYSRCQKMVKISIYFEEVKKRDFFPSISEKLLEIVLEYTKKLKRIIKKQIV